MTTTSGAASHNGSPDITRRSHHSFNSVTIQAGQEMTNPVAPNRPDELENVANHSRPGRWRRVKSYFGPEGNLRPFRLLKHDLVNMKGRYMSDWAVFNQQVVASSVYIFFTNILPGITFASDLYSLTGQSWGTIEIVFSTGLCGIIFAL